MVCRNCGSALVFARRGPWWTSITPTGRGRYSEVVPWVHRYLHTLLSLVRSKSGAGAIPRELHRVARPARRQADTRRPVHPALRRSGNRIDSAIPVTANRLLDLRRGQVTRRCKNLVGAILTKAPCAVERQACGRVGQNTPSHSGVAAEFPETHSGCPTRPPAGRQHSRLPPSPEPERSTGAIAVYPVTVTAAGPAGTALLLRLPDLVRAINRTGLAGRR